MEMHLPEVSPICEIEPPWDEGARIRALERYAILDTPVEPLFEEIVELIADVCDAPIAVVNFVASDRQWFKAERGIGTRELPLDVSVCRHAILQSEIFVVPDLTKDNRFANNPLVAREGGLRFYVGALLQTDDGLPLGTLCVLDTKPRPEGLGDRERRVLSSLARQVMSELDLRLALSERKAAEKQMRADAQRVQLALDAGAIIGTWFWDLREDRFEIDDQFATSFGINPERARNGLGFEQIIETVYPDDKPALLAAIREAVSRGGAYAHQYRVRRADGNYYWIEANGRVIRTEDVPVQFAGVLLDLEERRQIQAERDRALRLVDSFFEAVPGVVYAKDRDGRVMLGNRGATELIGKPPEEYIGKTDAEFLENGEQAAAIMANDRRVMEGGETEQVEEEIHLPDGSEAIWLSTKTPLRSKEGEVTGLIGASVDVTESRKALEREQMLAREVDHRAKNVLAVVQSVVQLTRGETIAGFKASVLGRIQALAHAHSLLAAGRWEGVELTQIFANELAPFMQAEERVKLSGPSMRLKPAASQAVAMVVHELATNAAKYGALSVPDGSLSVHWSVESGSGTEQALELRWKERGGPPVASPSRTGFGSTVIQSAVERQLGGSLQMNWNEGGFECHLKIPSRQLLGTVGATGEGVRRKNADGATPLADAAGAHASVLIVEDEVLIALELVDALKEFGWAVLGPVDSVPQALKLIEESRPDAAILDVNLNGERSDPVARELDRLGVPYVLCTGYAQEEQRDGGAPVGRLTKPFNPGALRAAVQNALQRPPFT